MVKALFLIIGLLLATSTFAAPVSTALTVTRDAKKVLLVKYDFWSYEYPSPVIDVSAKKPGTTKIIVEKSLSTLGRTRTCSIKNGIYHPWSETLSSVAKFVSLVPLTEYRVRKPHTTALPAADGGSDDVSLVRGEIFTRVIYLSEGFCSAEYVNIKGQRKDVDVECSMFDNTRLFARTVNSAPAPKDPDVAVGEQWMQVSCAEGYSGFIQDSALLKTPTVKEGKILGFGSVGSEDDASLVTPY